MTALLATLHDLAVGLGGGVLAGLLFIAGCSASVWNARRTYRRAQERRYR